MMQLLMALVALAAAPDRASELRERAAEAVSEDRYKDALELLEEAQRAALRANDALSYQSVRDERTRVRDLQRQWFRLARDRKKLVEDPDDARANLAVGRFYALAKGDYAGGLPALAKGSDKILSALARQDLDGPKGGHSLLSIGHSWWDAAAKAKKTDAPGMRRRALKWYEESWEALTGLERTRVRQRVAEVQRAPAGAFANRGPLEGWSYGDAGFRVGPSTVYTRSGARSVQVTAHETPTVYWPLSFSSVPLIGGKKYRISVAFMSLETDAADHLIAQVFSTDGKMVKQFVLGGKRDYPFWHSVEQEFEAPPGAITLLLKFAMPSLKGTLWVDDVSVVCDGKELLPNGSFER